MLTTFRSYQLAVEFYRLTRALHLPGGLSDQFRRASSSIALNLAEVAKWQTKYERKSEVF